MTSKKHPKRLWLVRHAEAVPAEEFDGGDLDRPLTGKGIAFSRRVFRQWATVCPAPDAVISSQATRAVQTAELLVKAFGIRSFKRSDQLNPGCRFAALRRVALDALAQADFVVLVGHEPDFSGAAARFIGAPAETFVLKKSGLIELELNRDKTWRLTLLVSPDVVAG